MALALEEVAPSTAEAEPARPPRMARRVLALAWPVIAQNLLETLVGVIDTLLVARLGTVAIAGVGTALQVVFFLIAVLSAVSIGASIIVAHAIGAGDRAGAQRLAKQTLVWALLASAPLLAERITASLGLRARYDKPGTIARMAMVAASSTDLAEAEGVGREAVRRALAGESDLMVTIERLGDDPYRVAYGAVPLAAIANAERRLPDEFIGADGRSVTAAFRRYATPLLGEPLQRYGRLADLPFPREQ